jgi:hypothetical protein
MEYTVIVKETNRGWFWRVAEDVCCGRGWSGEAGSASKAAEQASIRLKQVTENE